MAKDNARKGKRTIWVVLLILLLVLLTAVGGAMYVVDHYLDKINKINPDDDYIIPPENEDFETEDGAPPTSSDFISSDNASSAPDSSQPSSGTSSGGASAPTTSKPTSSAPPVVTPTVTFDDSKLINILLVGQDKDGKTTIRQRSDSMILCSINPDTKEVSLISFQRDLYVSIPGGYSNNRLNATYAFGGFKLLNRTLTQNFGVTIDGNIEVDFNRFKQVIDAVGGVEIALTAAEAKYLNVPGGKPCTVYMSGELALEYARIRIIDNDFNRAGRQRKVIMAVFNKIKNKNPAELAQLADTILPMLSTDMSNTEILGLMRKLIPMLPDLKIASHSIPAAGAYYSTYVRGMFVLVPNLNKNRQILRDQYLPLN